MNQIMKEQNVFHVNQVIIHQKKEVNVYHVKEILILKMKEVVLVQFVHKDQE